MSGIWEGLMGESAGPGDLDSNVVVLGQGNHIVQVGEWFCGRRWDKGLGQPHMVDNQLGIGMPAGELAHEGQLASTHHVSGETPAFPTAAKIRFQAFVVRLEVLAAQHHSHSHHARGAGPFGHIVLDGG